MNIKLLLIMLPFIVVSNTIADTNIKIEKNRPQSAINDFANWATQIKNTSMRTEFYPTVSKTNLFSLGYIIYKSGHSCGSTLDVTIVPFNSKIPAYNPDIKQVECTAPQQNRSPDNNIGKGQII